MPTALNEQMRKRFMGKVYMEPNSGCWLWEGVVTGQGYGAVTQNKKTIPAHRAAYQMFVGEIPKDTTHHHGTTLVLHKCDIMSCVNPDHLFLGTQKDNMIDMVKKGRCRPGCVKGEMHGSSKLNEMQVRIIKRLLSFKTTTQADIASYFNVAHQTITAIKGEYSWKHLKPKDSNHALSS